MSKQSRENCSQAQNKYSWQLRICCEIVKTYFLLAPRTLTISGAGGCSKSRHKSELTIMFPKPLNGSQAIRMHIHGRIIWVHIIVPRCISIRQDIGWVIPSKLDQVIRQKAMLGQAGERSHLSRCRRRILRCCACKV